MSNPADENSVTIVGRGSGIGVVKSTAGGMWCPICLRSGMYHWVDNVTIGETITCFKGGADMKGKPFVVTKEDVHKKHM